MKLDKLTIVVFCALLFVLFAYDIWTLSARGYDTTVSWTLYQWAKDWPAIPFAFGFFAGHLFFPNRAANKPSTYPPFQPIPLQKLADIERKILDHERLTACKDEQR